MADILIYVLVALQVGDIVSTYLCITSRKGTEANPLLRWLFDAVGLLPGLLIAKGVFVAGALVYGPQFPTWFIWGWVAIYALVVAQNINVLLKKI